MPIDALDLADFRKVDVEVGNVLGARREQSGIAGDPIVKPCPHGDQKVAVFHGVVCRSDAMHTQHVHGERVRCVTGAQCHQRCGDRYAVFTGETPHGFGRVRINNATARIDQRPFGFREHCEETFAGVIAELVLFHLGETPAITVQW